ncbi:phosphonopyruvate decarboxylase [Paremcibacter congregatus]|uniref:Phosphonopyruvate decarboxylase n=1 Tax=Paremcibacter congregatus TaxID=2043170 RepID=A0A2G4YV79_9PROT|nr:phosphonopyruvate decarboxylase [Paremcibacter congregatus]PHZ86262.1 phosphonopyruvate decarboxylase [Paremcibacter congregatus]QDE27229.1 phosphonopyruvate decarboxylase [Paremcibacter congregatus]
MIKPEDFYGEMNKNGLAYFTGVPDSLLKSFCAYVSDFTFAGNHVIAANEGGAIGLAIGYHLATGNTPVVYLQNSGLGNTINPLLSLADQKVYGIPMVLLIGWRGEITRDGQQLKDEPQHKKQGQVTEAMLTAMGISYKIIDADTKDYPAILAEMTVEAKSSSQPVALLVRKGTFAPYHLRMGDTPEQSGLKRLSRERAIALLVDKMPDASFVVSTTGMASRELYELRSQKKQGHEKDFLVVGGMGHASQIACEMSRRSEKQIYCLDGDGAFLMHMGSTALNAAGKFCHIVLNNQVHDSVGGQPTAASGIDIPAIALACGYQAAETVETEADLIHAMDMLADFKKKGSCLLEVKVIPGARKDLGRPGLSSQELKSKNMKYLGSI